MIKINREGLSSEQVNDIIVLVNQKKGKVYDKEEKGNKLLVLDLFDLDLSEKREVLKKIRKIKKGESST